MLSRVLLSTSLRDLELYFNISRVALMVFCKLLSLPNGNELYLLNAKNRLNLTLISRF